MFELTKRLPTVIKFYYFSVLFVLQCFDVFGCVPACKNVLQLFSGFHDPALTSSSSSSGSGSGSSSSSSSGR